MECVNNGTQNQCATNQANVAHFTSEVWSTSHLFEEAFRGGGMEYPPSIHNLDVNGHFFWAQLLRLLFTSFKLGTGGQSARGRFSKLFQKSTFHPKRAKKNRNFYQKQKKRACVFLHAHTPLPHPKNPLSQPNKPNNPTNPFISGGGAPQGFPPFCHKKPQKSRTSTIMEHSKNHETTKK